MFLPLSLLLMLLLPVAVNVDGVRGVVELVPVGDLRLGLFVRFGALLDALVHAGRRRLPLKGQKCCIWTTEYCLVIDSYHLQLHSQQQIYSSQGNYLQLDKVD